MKFKSNIIFEEKFCNEKKKSKNKSFFYKLFRFLKIFPLLFNFFPDTGKIKKNNIENGNELFFFLKKLSLLEL